MILCTDKVSQNSWTASARHEEASLSSWLDLRDRSAFYTQSNQNCSPLLLGCLQMPRPLATSCSYPSPSTHQVTAVRHIHNLLSRGLSEP